MSLESDFGDRDFRYSPDRHWLSTNLLLRLASFLSLVVTKPTRGLVNMKLLGLAEFWMFLVLKTSASNVLRKLDVRKVLLGCDFLTPPVCGLRYYTPWWSKPLKLTVEGWLVRVTKLPFQFYSISGVFQFMLLHVDASSTYLATGLVFARRTVLSLMTGARMWLALSVFNPASL